jgi:hypothetical protein
VQYNVLFKYIWTYQYILYDLLTVLVVLKSCHPSSHSVAQEDILLTVM